LLFRQERGGEARIVINVPYHLHGCRPVPPTCYNSRLYHITRRIAD
jgi:hypothetical protein